MLNPKTNQRELCYVVTVGNIEPMIGYDNLELATINGWHCVIGKNSMKKGDLAIYFEIDSKLPETPPFCNNQAIVKYKYKIKTQKFGRGGIKYFSQGLLMPLSDFEDLGLENVQEGDFLTKQLGVTYYEPEDNTRKASNEELIKMKVEKRMARWTKKHPFLSKFGFIVKIATWFTEKKIRSKQTKSKRGATAFPTHFPYIHKSDEERVENMPWILENKKPWVKTLKIDGTSSTYILERLKGKNKFEFYVLSRNVRQLTPDQKCYHDDNVYWEMAEKYNIEKFLKEQLELHPDWTYVAIQGESAGPAIQANPHGLKLRQFFGFNFIDSVRGRWGSVEARDYVAKWGIKWVPIVDENYILPDTMEEFKASADGPCELPGATGLREGYVYRSLDGKQSFKNVSNQFLMSKK